MKNTEQERKKTRTFRRLEELDLLDDFLFQEMVANPEVGEEFCRILLRVILGKEVRNVNVVPQRAVQGPDTRQHGIRLDAYIEEVSGEEILDARVVQEAKDIFDFEPNKVYEKNILPRKMRYYHGLIDTKLLEIGTSYEKLPNVFIIMILPYDPFGKKRMVYTVKNQCIEDSAVSYEDGAVKIFLYTRGTEGEPSQKLIDMLKYIEKSTKENIVNQDIKRLDELVSQVKQSREVDLSYMKSWEWEEYIKKTALKEGIEQGMERGIEQGMEQGMEQGRFSLLCEMVQEEKLSIQEASEKANMSVKSFTSKMKERGCNAV